MCFWPLVTCQRAWAGKAALRCENAFGCLFLRLQEFLGCSEPRWSRRTSCRFRNDLMFCFVLHFTHLCQQRHPAPGSQDIVLVPYGIWPLSASQICHQDFCLFSFRSLVCDGKRGLLTRLLQVMKKEPAESSFR